MKDLLVPEAGRRSPSTSWRRSTSPGRRAGAAARVPGRRARMAPARRARPTATAGAARPTPPGLPPAGGLLDLLGLEGRLLLVRGRRPGVLRRDLLHARHPDGRANSPQWFNTGLHWAYGIGARRRATTASTRRPASWSAPRRPTSGPRPHACFIQSVEDDLVNEGGIMDLWVREAASSSTARARARNFSALRGEGEPLSGGGNPRADELPQDRRPGGRRHQVRRHHPQGRQDGRPRSRSPGHRGVHQLEGGRGAEGRRPGHRLASCTTSTSTPC